MTGLTREQLEAARHFLGPALVVAGPGSGKTTVFTKRIHSLVLSGVPEEKILCLTFTNEAAMEISDRYALLSERSENHVTFGTFHSAFLLFLREYMPRPHLAVANTAQSIEALCSIKPRLGPDKAEVCLHEISRIKNLVSCGSAFTRELLPLYERELHKRGLMDFDDMLLLFLKLLKSDAAVLRDIRNRIGHILLDEFQDINRLQFEAVRLIASPGDNIFAVGDDDQSIYGFRGSDPSIMLSFQDLYPEAKVMTLSDNFRSQRKIALAASHLIAHNKKRFHKDFRFPLPPLEAPDIRSFRDEAAEAAAVTEAVKKTDPTQSIGVLYRTHRAGSPVIKHLSEQGLIQSGRVRAMTFHMAKGLEFDRVFIVHANDETTPGKVRDKAALEEERRMFYVAVTRAKQSLHIFNTNKSYNAPCTRSRFVRECR